jgi:hypothetical protein
MMGDAVPRYPNARARIRRIRNTPGAALSEHSMVIWLRDSAFRVRDEAGRPYSDVMSDVTAARGFGTTPRTMEEFMDVWDASRTPSDRGSTEFYGDLTTGNGTVREVGRESWSIDATVIAPVAEQLLTDGRETSLEPVAMSTCLDRPCAEYRFSSEGDEDGIPYRSDIRWLVCAPFVLLREVRDSKHPNLSVRTEVIELAEGTVTDADLRP